MKLPKNCQDVGLYTNRSADLRAFYVDRLGLHDEERLKAGRGIHQHRVRLHGLVLKINDSRETLADAPRSFVRLDIHADHEETLLDPEGTQIVLCSDVEHMAIHWRSSDRERLTTMLRDGFGAHDEGAWRWSVGTTVLVLHAGGGPVGPLRSRGFRYLTVQVFDVRAEHTRLLQLGRREALAPTRLGETAFISFVLDHDGAPIEISQRASLTGPLPEV